MSHDAQLDSILEGAWSDLTRAARDPDHGYHWPVLATVGLSGEADARTVVLRHVDAHHREASVHSDARAGKLVQIRRDPRVCLVLHHPPARTQLRVHGRAQVHCADDQALRAWRELPDHSRALYAGPARFALIRVSIDRLDWLLIDPTGHRRAGFDWPGGTTRAVWLEP